MAGPEAERTSSQNTHRAETKQSFHWGQPWQVNREPTLVRSIQCTDVIKKKIFFFLNQELASQRVKKKKKE